MRSRITSKMVQTCNYAKRLFLVDWVKVLELKQWKISGVNSCWGGGGEIHVVDLNKRIMRL